ncbi:murein biosynthesis integral membrane protein MurJ [Lysinibacillus sp. SGAir0095]|uniref:murein biosynthesis integral membrane protein MurJ n=1 Tax=Lysinibacillus sp. SGAir0095 TaxID=2070463 RepID=UPI0010CD3776|nr:lipid II flippase MurJ [Lysinibacillus sp. SGAir0095]QCR31473.1 murein biosynthesis protein MurJ [Lysinibacillus sp. SGAir0095]
MNKFIKVVGAVAIINIVARLFGFFREMAIGYQYGLSYVADSIFTAYTLPNFLYLVIGGAFTTAVISLYNKKTTDQALFVKQSFTIVLVSVSIMTIIVLFFTTPILNIIYNKNYDISPEEFELAKHLFYWMMPSSILLCLASWYSGLLNINDKFHLSSVSILIYNAFFLLIAVGLSFVVGPIAYGISAFASAVIMIYFLVVGYRKLNSHPVGLSFKRDATTKELWLMVLPIAIGGGTLQIYAMLQRFFVMFFGFGESAISVVNYSSRLMQFPQAILITAVTTVIYPILSKKEAEDDYASIKNLYSKGLHYLLLLLIPVSIYSFFYSKNILQVVYERGNFTAEATMITTPVLQIFVLSMFFLAANTYITRFYYAKADSMAPVVFSLINVFVINIAVMYLMADATGVNAIAWGTLISSIINTIMLIVYAHFKYDLKLGSDKRSSDMVKSIVSFILIAIVMYVSSTYLEFDNKWVTFAVGLIIFTIVTLGSYLLFGIKEVKDYLLTIKNKLFKIS